MARSVALTTAVIVHAIYAVLMFALSIMSFDAAVRHHRVRPVLSGISSPLVVAGYEFAFLVIVYCVAAYQLSHSRIWGWWLALVADVVVIGRMLYHVIPERDWGGLLTIGLFAVSALSLIGARGALRKDRAFKAGNSN